MAAVVCVHGIGQQRKGEGMLHGEWSTPLVDGVCLAAGVAVSDGPISVADVRCISYGDLFRPAGSTLAVGDPYLTAQDVTADDAELLLAWWREAAETDPGVIHPDVETLVRAPRSVHAALRALSGSRFFAGIANRAMVFDLQQVRRYLMEPATRAAVQDRVVAAVTKDTRVVVGHSLGSVVAYEVLCANPGWPVRALVTLGSPLGIRHLVFNRLVPRPLAPGSFGAWPGGVDQWVNIADAGDVVALVKDLKPLFGERVRCHLVHNGSAAHDVSPYLTAVETGQAILEGLAG